MKTVILGLFALAFFQPSYASVLCGTQNRAAVFTAESSSAVSAAESAVSRCRMASGEGEACQPASCQELVNQPTADYKKCNSNDDCPGFANYCFAGRCQQEGYFCNSNDDCPGFANYCFAGKCSRQEPLCNSDKDCPGFANYCFAGKCQNP